MDKLQEIKDEVARVYGFLGWAQLYEMANVGFRNNCIDSVAERYAKYRCDQLTKMMLAAPLLLDNLEMIHDANEDCIKDGLNFNIPEDIRQLIKKTINSVK